MEFRARVRSLEAQLDSLTWNSTVDDQDTLAELEEALKPVEEIVGKWYSKFWAEADE